MKGQWGRNMMSNLICLAECKTTNLMAGDLKLHDVHCDATVMTHTKTFYILTRQYLTSDL